MNLHDLPTPALILDRQRLRANAAAMLARAKRLGVNLRPHCKTAKSADVAKLATEGAFGGITVSTLREADYFLGRGFTDIVYAVGIVPNKLDIVARLQERGADIKIVTDNVPMAEAVARHGAPFRALIEIDTGDGRGGVPADGKDLPEIARALTATNTVTLMGVLTHAGQSYDERDPKLMAEVAERERAGAVAAAKRVRDLGFEAPIVSVGSTPTATFARDLTGVTEMRPGVYVFYDLYQAGIGVCDRDDIALSVLASVIGHRRNDNVVLIDAGALALSKDRSTEKLGKGDCAFGLVCDADSGKLFPGLKVIGVSQEHGRISSDAPLPFDKFPIGGQVRVLPNHACITAAAYDTYTVIDGGTDVVARWDRCNGW